MLITEAAHFQGYKDMVSALILDFQRRERGSSRWKVFGGRRCVNIRFNFARLEQSRHSDPLIRSMGGRKRGNREGGRAGRTNERVMPS